MSQCREYAKAEEKLLPFVFWYTAKWLLVAESFLRH